MGKSQIEGFAIGLMFVPMVFPIIMVSYVIFKMSDIIGPLLELIPKAISVALTIFDPKKFINDLIFGITFGVKMMFSGIFTSFDSVTSTNKNLNKKKCRRGST